MRHAAIDFVEPRFVRQVGHGRRIWVGTAADDLQLLHHLLVIRRGKLVIAKLRLNAGKRRQKLPGFTVIARLFKDVEMRLEVSVLVVERNETVDMRQR